MFCAHSWKFREEQTVVMSLQGLWLNAFSTLSEGAILNETYEDLFFKVSALKRYRVLARRSSEDAFSNLCESDKADIFLERSFSLTWIESCLLIPLVLSYNTTEIELSSFFCEEVQ
jgi:hypothetical protein